jgi:hypothetical protein
MHLPASRTVKEYVDPHARRLVDAINTCPLGARTFACCSGHYHKPGLPYVAFYSCNWEFVRLLLSVITGINRASRGYTSVALSHFLDEREIAGSIRLGAYPWLVRDGNLLPLATDQTIPSRQIARLWWRELDEVAGMLEERRTWPSREFVSCVDELWDASFGRRSWFSISRHRSMRQNARPRERL